MAEALTYTSLVEDIKLYAERTDNPFIEQIPRFIMLAENRLASELRGLGYLKVVSFYLQNGLSVYQKPSRWRETKELSITVGTERKFLFGRAYSWCRNYWPDSSTTTTPDYYADYDYEHLFIVGTPDSNYSAELVYHERPEPLSESNQTNWTTQYAPQLILYASLLEAQPFLKNTERFQEWNGLFDRASQAFAREQELRNTK